MAYDRNANAAANLAAAGIARNPKVQPYRQWRALPAAVRGEAIGARVRRDVQYRPGGSQASIGSQLRPARRGRPLRSVETAAGSLHYTGSQKVVIDLLKQARDRQHLVAFRATFRNENGQPRTRIVEGSPAKLEALDVAVEAGSGSMVGEGGQRPLPLDAHTLAGRKNRPGIEIRTGTHPGNVYPGLDPNEVLALAAAFGGDVWAAIYVLWAVGYDES